MASRASILVIYTGGTIGMQPGDRGLAPGGDFASRMSAALESLSPARRARLPAYTLWESPAPIDSSSASPCNWIDIAARIAECYRDYSGFVILHGTDTLAWCASALAFELQGLTRPVVVTGSQKPLGSESSDALANLEAALCFAAMTDLREVALAFGGRLLRGCRSRKMYTHDALGFDSPNWPLLGEIIEHEPVLHPARCLPTSGAPRFQLTRPLAPLPVVRLTLWPGMRADLVSRWLEDDTVRGAVIECWGSGNLPEDPALIGALARAVGEGKMLVAVTQCTYGGVELGVYASGATLNEIGVVSADDMTVEAAFCKLLHLLSLPLPPDEIRRRFLTPLIGERGAFSI